MQTQKEIDSIEFLAAFLEGAIEQQTEIVNTHNSIPVLGEKQFNKGKLEALIQLQETVNLMRHGLKK